MSTITKAEVVIAMSGAHILWETMGDADEGTAFVVVGANDLTVQVAGTFGSATVQIQGSLDGENWATIHDAFGTLLAFTAAATRGIGPTVPYIRPITTGGSGTDVDVVLFARAI